MTKFNLQNGRTLAKVFWANHAFLLFRQQVELALPFRRRNGGVRVTNSLRLGGVGVTFLFAKVRGDWLHNHDSRQIVGNAKGMFTNLLETKAGQSPECLEENLKRERSRRNSILAIAKFPTKRGWKNWFPLYFEKLASTAPLFTRTAN